jgi:hypothetical protein
MASKHVFMSIGLVLAWAALCVGVTTAKTWSVEQDGSGDWVTIQLAIDAAADGDTISIGAGWYQETNEEFIPFFGETWAVTAYWNDGRELALIGVDKESVKIGPPAYSVNGNLGILALNSGAFVSQITVVNCVAGIYVTGVGNVENCDFTGSRTGIKFQDCDEGTVSDCIFTDSEGNTGYGVAFKSSANVKSFNCTYINSRVRFDYCSNFQLTSSVFSDLSSAFAYVSGGEVSDCVFDSGHLGVISGNTVVIRDCKFLSGNYNLYLSGPATRVELYGNVLTGADVTGISTCCYASISGSDNHILLGNSPYSVTVTGYGSTWPYTLDLANNYWGVNDAASIDEMIYDANDTPETPAVVTYFPFSGMPLPTESTSWGSVKAIFR